MPSSSQGWKRNPLEEVERLGISRSFAAASVLSSATKIHCVSLCYLILKQSYEVFDFRYCAGMTDALGHCLLQRVGLALHLLLFQAAS